MKPLRGIIFIAAFLFSASAPAFAFSLPERLRELSVGGSFVPRLLLFAALVAVGIPTVRTRSTSRKMIGFFCVSGAIFAVFAASLFHIPQDRIWLPGFAGLIGGAAVGYVFFAGKLAEERKGGGRA